MFELFQARKLMRDFDANVVMHFTTAWRYSDVPQVVRSVYSNLFFPEIDFWPRRPRAEYFRRKLIDRGRIVGTLRADGIIFENRAMAERAVERFSYPKDRTAYIAPSVATLVSRSENGSSRSVGGNSVFRVLYLTSWHLNKNLQILPEVAAELKRQGVRVRFVISLDGAADEVKHFIVDPALQLGVGDYFEFIGTVHPDSVEDVILSVDSMVLLSQLECFSANISEAWVFGRPLIISDREWARSICGDGAIYVDRDNPEDTARAISELVGDVGLRERVVLNGARMLKSLNDHDSRFEQLVDFLEHINEIGPRS